MMLPPSSPHALIVQRLSSFVAIAIGLLVLFGWMTENELIKSLAPGWVAMKANTAVGFILSGFALWFLDRRENKNRMIIARTGSALVIVISSLTLIEYIWSFDFGIDQILFADKSTLHTSFPGRMAPHTAINFLFLGSALVMMTIRPSLEKAAHVIALVVAFDVMLVIAGYTYGVESLYRVMRHTPIALHTALTFLILAVGILAARPDIGVTKILVGNHVGSYIARRILPAAVLIPFGLGWLRLKGEQSELYEETFGIALLVVSTITLFIAFIFLTSRSLNLADAKRKKLASDLSESDALKDSLLSTARLGLSIVDEEGNILFTNSFMKELANDEILGRRCWEVYKDDLTQCDDCPLKQGIAINGVKTVETHGAFGSRVYEINHVGILYQGKKAMLEVFQDITERKKAEEHIRYQASLLARVNDAVLASDEYFVMTSWNHAAERIYGWTAEEAVGQTGETLFHSEFIGRSRTEAIAELRDTGELFTELVQRRKDGTKVFIESHAAALRDGGGRTVGYLSVNRDITERKKAEDELLASEQRYHDLYENAPDMHLSIDVQTGSILKCNRTLLEETGYERSEMLGKSIFEIYDPASHLQVKQALAAFRSTGEVKDMEMRIRTKEGTAIDVSLSATSVRDNDGRIIESRSVWRNITERKRAEKDLLEKERLLTESQSIAHIGSWYADVNGTVTWTEETYRIYGVDPDTFTPTIESLIELIIPEDRAVMQAWIQECMSGKQSRDLKYRILLPDDTIRYLNGRGKMILDNQNKPLYFAGTVQDITERREAHERLRGSEERFRVTFETAAIGVALVSLDGEWLRVNPRLCSIVGYTEDELMNLTFQDITHPDDLETDLNLVRKLLAGEINSYTLEKRYIRKDKSLVWINLTASLVRTADGQPDYFIATVEEITSRKAAHEEIVRLNAELDHRVKLRTAQLEAANKELEAFAYSVSHDLRAPLRGIDGFSLALLEDYDHKLDHEGKANLRRVRSAAQRMESMIDEMLTLSRVTRSEIRFQRLDLSNMATEIAEEYKQLHPDREVFFDIAPSVTASADPTLARILLTNLIDNAWKFTSKHPSARIAFGVTGQDSGTAFYVQDDGAGFDPQFTDQLFRAFQRLHKSTEFPGTGIGLATVQRIVHRHGGTVWAEGDVERGATFFFTLSGKD